MTLPLGVSQRLATIDRLEPATVPCGTCRRCCQNTLVLILPEMGDDATLYQTQDLGDGIRALATKDNGDCAHLGPEGCTVHGRAPHMCQIFDCRAMHAFYTREQRRRMVRDGVLDREILKRGEELRRAAV